MLVVLVGNGLVVFLFEVIFQVIIIIFLRDIELFFLKLFFGLIVDIGESIFGGVFFFGYFWGDGV